MTTEKILSLSPSFIANHLLKTFYKNYSPSNITSKKAATKEMWRQVKNKDMVIVFVHSQTDDFIQIDSSWRLYRELKKMDFKNLYLIEAEEGVHGVTFMRPAKQFVLEKLCLIS